MPAESFNAIRAAVVNHDCTPSRRSRAGLDTGLEPFSDISPIRASLRLGPPYGNFRGLPEGMCSLRAIPRRSLGCVNYSQPQAQITSDITYTRVHPRRRNQSLRNRKPPPIQRLIITAALLLAGCQHTQPRIETVTVKVPVASPCLRLDQVPPIPAKPALPDDAVAALAVAVSRVLDLSVYASTADALMRTCASK